MQKTSAAPPGSTLTPWSTSDRGALAKTLRELRTTAGLSQQVLGARLNRPQSYVSKIESAQRRVELQEIQDWARACGKSVRWAFVDDADAGEDGARTGERDAEIGGQDAELLSTLSWLLPRLSVADHLLLQGTIRYLMEHQETERR